MRKLILKWLGLEINRYGDLRTVIRDEERVTSESINHRIGVIKTLNGGCVLEIGTYKVSNGRGLGHNDWVYEFYTVGENQKISEAVGLVLVMKGLEK